MLPSRISFGHAVRLGAKTCTSIDLEKIEFQGWKAEVVVSLQAIQITPLDGNIVLIPLGNVAYCEMKADVTRSESTKTPDRIGQEGKGKARAT